MTELIRCACGLLFHKGGYDDCAVCRNKRPAEGKRDEEDEA